MQLLVLPDARFTCSSCTNCCRDWHVELMDNEAKQISGLSWPAGDSLRSESPLFRHAGKTFLAHRSDGACVFLNPANALCRIHEEFGESAKPLGCRLYPFQLMRTFNDEISVTARFDCPTVRQNKGQLHEAALPALQKISTQITFGDEITSTEREEFAPEIIQTICEFAGLLMSGFARSEERALFLVLLCESLASVDPPSVDRQMLGQQFPKLKAAVEKTVTDSIKQSGIFHRLAFRTLLGLYARRDEDVLNGFASRSGRLIGMLSIVLGFGRLRAIGRSHPQSRLGRGGLFRRPLTVERADVFEPCWRMIGDRLASLQFMAAANPNHGFLAGLRSLALTYPLVAVVARCAAADRNGDAISLADVDQAVGIIGHSFGRSALLAQSLGRSLETLLLEPQNFARLVRSV